ncbi:uncharacterized protein LOC121467100 [Drosophila elegans]|uniref:uncharacterized protein LOC121467100 n=1 Tax=Drosophila elegans TaxID=30023 RepID=UPI001BC8386E|nr:uncharacterized protein LOC121467100 [Drosophila elegans]
MKTPKLTDLTEDSRESSLESFDDNQSVSQKYTCSITSPYNVYYFNALQFNGDLDSGEVCSASDQNKRVQMYEQRKISDLEERLANSEKDKIRLYEALIREKDDVIKSLRFSIDLITETKEFSIKQMKSQIYDLQNAIDFKNSLNLNIAQGVTTCSGPKDEGNNSINQKSNHNELQALQNKMESLEITNKKDKELIAELESKIKVENAEIELKIKEKDAKMEDLKKNDDCLRARISELEYRVSIIEEQIL